MSSSERAIRAVREERVKLHVFEPSGRLVWTVVGKTGEHWVDVDAQFCSCHAYFFAMVRGHPGCYHLESVNRAKNSAHGVKFPDSEYGMFLAEIAKGFSPRVE